MSTGAMDYMSYNHEKYGFGPYSLSPSDTQNPQNLLHPSFATDFTSVSPRSSTFSTFTFPNYTPATDFNNSPGYPYGGLYTFAAGESEEVARVRLTSEQVWALEKHFLRSPKPNSTVKRALAEATGLTLQRVGNWFQNRRQKAKLQKQQEELRTMRILESAGRRRTNTEPSSPMTGGSPEDFQTTSRLQRSKSTTVTPRNMEKSSDSPTFSSKSEESYASLARSLAAASAAAQISTFGQVPSGDDCPSLSGTSPVEYQNLGYMFDPTDLNYVPSSAFSDWGSSTCYTPTPYNQLDDPFEFDRKPAAPSPYMTASSSRHPASALAPVFQDNYSEFAAAIEINAFETAFCMPLAQPPTSRKESVPSSNAESSDFKTARPQLKRLVTSPPNMGAFGGTQFTTGASEILNSAIASRRIANPAALVPKMTRSNSSSSLLQADSSMRRIKSTSGNGRVQKFSTVTNIPRSPLRMEQNVEHQFFSSGESDSSSRRPSEANSQFSQATAYGGHITPPTPGSPVISPEVDLIGISYASTMLEKPTFDFSSPPVTPQTAFSTPVAVVTVSVDPLNPLPQRITDLDKIFNHSAESPKETFAGMDVFEQSFSSSFDMSFDDVENSAFFNFDGFDQSNDFSSELFSSLDLLTSDITFEN